MQEALDRLRESAFPWSRARPLGDDFPRANRGNLLKGLNKIVELLEGRDTPVILEIGSETGGSARHFCERLPTAVVIACDVWIKRSLGKGFYCGTERSEEADRALSITRHAGMWPVFAHQVRDHRDRIIPLRGDRLEAMRTVHAAGVRPTLVYVDCIHKYKEVTEDLELAFELFPQAILCGDDYWARNGEVIAAVEDFSRRIEAPYVLYGGQYVFLRNLSTVPVIEEIPELAKVLAQREAAPGASAITGNDALERAFRTRA